MQAGLLGSIHTPKQGNKLPAKTVWCADNGCFGKGYPGDDKWLAWLGTYTAEERSRCLFATAPDVVGDAVATLVRSVPWLSAIRELGYPAAFVAQDGLENLVIPWDSFDVLFIGGSTDWKLGTDVKNIVAVAVSKGKTVHMGRVNSYKRIRYADSIGCSTSDGTYISFGPDRNLPKALGWLEKLALANENSTI